jgi:hypothetical protein
VPKQLRIRSYRMNLPPLRTLFFEDLSIGRPCAMRLPNEVRAAKCSERWMGLRR